MAHHGKEITKTGSAVAGHIAQAIRKHQRMNGGVVLTLFIFSQDSHGMVLPTCRVDLTFASKPSWKHPYRHIQRYVPIVIF